MTQRFVWSDPIPVAERMPRDELVGVANLYFTGLQKNDGKGEYPFTEDCDRIEKGKIHQILAIMERVPYGMNSGWSTWEEGLSSTARDITR